MAMIVLASVLYASVGALLWWRIIRDGRALCPMDLFMLPVMMGIWPGLVLAVGLVEVWNT